MKKKTLIDGTDRLYGAFTGVCLCSRCDRDNHRGGSDERLRRRKIPQILKVPENWEMTSTVSAWSLTVRQ